MPNKKKMDINSKKVKMPSAKSGKGTRKSTSYTPRKRGNR